MSLGPQEASDLEAAVLTHYGKCVCLTARRCTCPLQESPCVCDLAICPGHRFVRQHWQGLCFARWERDNWLAGEGIKPTPPAENSN
jgi:hypothetical protein